MKYTLGFIGVGNMGSALAVAAAKNIDGNEIAVCDRNAEQAEKVAVTCSASATNALDIAKNSRFVVMGVKPVMMPQAFEEIAPALKENPHAVIISMGAGVSIWDLQRYMEDDERAIIRIMPNTSCRVGEGVIQFSCHNVSDDDKAVFCHAFAAAGFLDEILEGKIDAASALSGCGPAFVYLFAEALADGAVECGLPRDKAILYAAKTLVGAGKMIEEFGHLSDLKDAVCSPGGTTIAGVHALEKGGLRAAAMDAVVAAYRKTIGLDK